MNTLPTDRIYPLPRGIHPPENKRQSLREPIRKASMPARLVLPLTQPGFLQAEPLVQVGQQVLKGEILARGTPGMGVTVHASTSGTVVAIDACPVPNASGLPEACIVLEPDGRDTWQRLPAMDFRHCETHSLIERIDLCGISGLGGAGFPTHTKLEAALGKVHTLILNGAECEPFITADHALMRERADDILLGVRILLQITGAERCLVGIEDNKGEAIDAMQAAIEQCNDPRIKQVVIPTLYPSGGEKQLVYILTGNEVASGSFALASGILCHNVGTAWAIARAVVQGEALVSRIVTVSGAAVARPGNLDACLGTPLTSLLEDCEVNPAVLSRLIHGGPLMGLQLPHADLPVLKITNCVIASTVAEMPPPPPAQACIRCGFCADVCPVTLLPQQLYWFSRSKELEKAEAHNLFDCIECGACAYVCPSHIPLVQYYRAAKAELRDERDKHRMAEQAKQRFEFQQQRKEEEKRREERRRAERAALAKQRKEAAAASGSDAQSDAKAAIAAAMARVQARKASEQDQENKP